MCRGEPTGKSELDQDLPHDFLTKNRELRNANWLTAYMAWVMQMARRNSYEVLRISGHAIRTGDGS